MKLQFGKSRMARPFSWLYAASMLFGSALALGTAQAQTATSTTYDSWTTRCSLLSDQGKTVKACEVVATMATQLQNGQTVPTAVMAIGRADTAKSLKLVIQVPINAWLPNGVKLQDKAGKEILSLPFTHCRPDNMCEASIDVTDGQAQSLKKQGDSIVATYRNVTQKEVSQDIILKGYGSALDLLLKEMPSAK